MEHVNMSNIPIDSSLPCVNLDLRGVHYKSSECLVSVIMHSRGRPNLFMKSIASLVKTCSNIDEVEIVMKLDSDDATAPEYLDILNKCPFSYKILVYDRMEAYWSLYIFQNDLSRIANGDVLWLFNEDNQIVSGDWLHAFRESRNVFPDNIYVCHVPGHASKKAGKCVSPAYTREWFQVTGMVSPHVFSDRFLSVIAGQLGRFLYTPLIGSIQFMHEEENKIPRPKLSSTKQSLMLNLNQRVKQYAPAFRDAINDYAQKPDTEDASSVVSEKKYPPGTKVGPGYTE